MQEVLLSAATSNLVHLDDIIPDQVASASVFTYITMADKGNLALLPSKQGLVPSSRPVIFHPCCVLVPLSGVHCANERMHRAVDCRSSP